MKRMIGIIFIVICLLCSTVVAYGDEMDLRYIHASQFASSFHINANGEADVAGELFVNDSSKVDKVTASYKIVKVGTSEVVCSRTIVMSYSSLAKMFTFSDSQQLKTRGKYRLEVAYKCYSGSKLLETVKAEPVVKTY